MTNNIRERLRDADPLEREPGLMPADVEVMRRAVLSKANAPAPHGYGYTTVLVLATVVAALMIAAFAGHRFGTVSELPQHTEQRHLQFETPGGTRIIWVLNPDFELSRGTP